MAIIGRLEDFLDKNHVSYERLTHKEAFTAQELAAAMHVSGKDLAKVVIVRADDRFVMTVLPASSQVDFSRLRGVLKVKDVRLATEQEFKGLFPDCEPGSEPPFGNLYDLETVVDTSLSEDTHIFFNAGNHQDSVGMDFSDFERLVRPRVADFAVGEL